MKELSSEYIAQIKESLPQYDIKDFIGGGRFGNAFSTQSGAVLKLTLDPREFHLAEDIFLTKTSFDHYVEILECVESVIMVDERTYSAILQEYVDVNSHKEDVSTVLTYLRKIWFNEGMGILMGVKNNLRLPNYDDLSHFLIEGTSDVIENARHDFQSLAPYQIDLYDTLIDGLKDLSLFCKKLSEREYNGFYRKFSMDISEDNIGFDKGGKLKLFDQGEERWPVNPKPPIKQVYDFPIPEIMDVELNI